MDEDSTTMKIKLVQQGLSTPRSTLYTRLSRYRVERFRIRDLHDQMTISLNRGTERSTIPNFATTIRNSETRYSTQRVARREWERIYRNISLFIYSASKESNSRMKILANIHKLASSKML